MPTMNISLPAALASFIESEVRSGRYASSSELVRESLRLLEREKAVEAEKLRMLKQAIQDGLDDVEAGRLSTRTAREIAEQVLRDAGRDAT